MHNTPETPAATAASEARRRESDQKRHADMEDQRAAATEYLSLAIIAEEEAR